MAATSGRLTVLQSKFSAYLAWSQPFIHHLLTGLSEHVDNVVVCNRTENLDRFPTPSVARLKHRFLVEPSPGLRAAAYLREHHAPDLIHGHFGWSGIRMLLIKQFLRVPLVTTFGGRDATVQMKLPYFDRLYGILLDASEAIVCVSRDLKDELVGAGVAAHRIEVIHRGTSLQHFAFVDRSGRPAEAPLRVAMVGRLIEKKGHPYAFAALRELVREGRDVRLTIVGEGETYQELRTLQRELELGDRITFEGVVDQTGVRRVLHAADVFVHCSVTGSDGDREGIPNVIVEAAATGLPVVGTQHGGIVETIKDGETGLLVKERDVPALTQALRRLASQRDERLAMGRSAAAFMQSDFDLARQVERHVAIYRKLAEEFPAGSEAAARTRVPTDFADLLDKALANEKEFSIAEMVERLLSPGGLDADILTPEPGALANLYELKRLIPQRVKWPAKVALGRLLARLIALRMRLGSRYSEQLRRIDALNGEVMQYLDQGGSVEGVDPHWGADELAAFLTRAKAAADPLPGPVDAG